MDMTDASEADQTKGELRVVDRKVDVVEPPRDASAPASAPGLAAPGPDRSFAAFGCDRCARSEAGEGDLIGLRADEALPGQEDGSSVPAMNHTRAVARKSHVRHIPRQLRYEPRGNGR